MSLRKSSELTLVKDIFLNDLTPELTLIVPVFNKENTIQEILTHAINKSALKIDVIVIDDCSDDSTSERILQWLNEKSLTMSNVQNIRFFQSNSQLFESKCDDFAFRISRTRYAIELQADMRIHEFAFDNKLLTAITTRSDFIAISGRGCHSFELVCDSFRKSMGAATFDDLSFIGFISSRPKELFKSLLKDLKIYRPLNKRPVRFKVESGDVFKKIFPDADVFSESGSAGKLGELIEIDIKAPSQLNRRIWVSDTVMRGPLIIDLEKYVALGGFALDSFFLGYDEHDLFLRGAELGYFCGYLPVDFDSPLSAGSSRSHRSFRTQLLFIRMILTRWPNRKHTALYQFGGNSQRRMDKNWQVINY